MLQLRTKSVYPVPAIPVALAQSVPLQKANRLFGKGHPTAGSDTCDENLLQPTAEPHNEASLRQPMSLFLSQQKSCTNPSTTPELVAGRHKPASIKHHAKVPRHRHDRPKIQLLPQATSNNSYPNRQAEVSLVPTVHQKIPTYHYDETRA